MQRDDKPTNSQLNLLYRWYKWRLPMALAIDMVKWLENNATKLSVSKEIARVHDLYHDHKLDEESCFDSAIWNGYKLRRDSNA